MGMWRRPAPTPAPTRGTVCDNAYPPSSGISIQLARSRHHRQRIRRRRALAHSCVCIVAAARPLFRTQPSRRAPPQSVGTDASTAAAGPRRAAAQPPRPPCRSADRRAQRPLTTSCHVRNGPLSLVPLSFSRAWHHASVGPVGLRPGRGHRQSPDEQ
eukprot:365986-Chlamydomonas_euryale.AAC.7